MIRPRDGASGWCIRMVHMVVDMTGAFGLAPVFAAREVGTLKRRVLTSLLALMVRE
ncbi:hypothetical protein BPY_15020 [Bifidobacterium psychraerophilum]